MFDFDLLPVRSLLTYLLAIIKERQQNSIRELDFRRSTLVSLSSYDTRRYREIENAWETWQRLVELRQSGLEYEWETDRRLRNEIIDVKRRAGYRVNLSIVAANVQRADVRRIRIVTVRANDNGLPFSDITGESHSRRRFPWREKKKKRKKEEKTPPRATFSRDFALNHRYLPSQTSGFFSFRPLLLYYVHATFSMANFLRSLKWPRVSWLQIHLTFLLHVLIIIYTARHL